MLYIYTIYYLEGYSFNILLFVTTTLSQILLSCIKNLGQGGKSVVEWQPLINPFADFLCTENLATAGPSGHPALCYSLLVSECPSPCAEAPGSAPPSWSALPGQTAVTQSAFWRPLWACSVAQWHGPDLHTACPSVRKQCPKGNSSYLSCLFHKSLHS